MAEWHPDLEAPMRLWVLESFDNCEDTAWVSPSPPHKPLLQPHRSSCPPPPRIRCAEQQADRSSLVSTEGEGAGERAGGRPCLYPHRNQEGGWNQPLWAPPSLPGLLTKALVSITSCAHSRGQILRRVL